MQALLIFLIGIQSAGLIANISLLFSQYFENSLFAISLAVTVFYVASFLSTMLFSTLSDYLQHHRMLIVGISLFAAVGLFFGILAETPKASFIWIVFLVSPATSLSAIFFAYVSQSEKDASKTVVLRGFFSAAWVIGPVVGTRIAADANFDWLFFALSINALAIALFALFLPSRSFNQGVKATESHLGSQSVVPLLVGFAVMIVLQGAMSLSTTILPIIITNEISFDHSDTGVAFAITALSEVVMIFLMSRLYNRTGAMLLMCAGCVAGFFYYAAIAVTSDIRFVFAAQILNGIYIASMIGIGMVWFQRLAPKRPGFAMGLFLNSYSVGSIMFTPLAGYVAEVSGSFQMAAWCGVVGIGVGAIALLSFERKMARTRSSLT